MPLQTSFVFPRDHHLVITTERHVLSYDNTGLHDVFQSGSSGILAAKEARDGSGTLAIADSQVVVLHRVERGMETSYRLKGTEGQIRLLEFTADSKTLYFTTTLLNAVQSYSLREARLLNPGPTHASAPTVLALSPTSHLLLTASESPPTVYLQNLSLGTQPLFLQPHASFSPVVCAAFHPERPDLFLLAFKDGTLAAYDATRLMRSSGKANGNSRAEGEEIGCFKSLHAITTRARNDLTGAREARNGTTTAGARSLGITGAAFLPGYRIRAITVGADGKCKIVDFEKDQIVQTWHVRGPATSLTVLSPNLVRRTSKAALPGKSTSSKTVISIGRLDGKVLLFDDSGSILHDLSVDDSADRVIDVEWIKGPGLKILGNSEEVQFTSENWIELYAVGDTLRSRMSGTSRKPSISSRQESRQSHEDNTALSGPVEVDRSTDASPDTSPDPPSDDKVEIPTMDFFDTVKHCELQGLVHQNLPPLSNNYMDLFSPVKRDTQSKAPPRLSPPKRRTTPRSRPRLSSSTFVYQGVNAQNPQQPNFQAIDKVPTNSGSAKPVGPSKSGEQSRPGPPKKRSVVPGNIPNPRPSPGLRAAKIPGSYAFNSSATPSSSSSASSANSKILADIRRFGEKATWSKDGHVGNRAILAPYMPVQTRKSPNRRASGGVRPFEKPKSQLSPEKQKKTEDTNAGDDIWLTAESDVGDEGPAVSSASKRKAVSKNSRAHVRQGSRMWEELERQTSRKPTHSGSHKASIEIKLAPPRTKTIITLSEPHQSVESRSFSTQFRNHGASPSPSSTDFSEISPSSVQRPTTRRKSRSAPTAKELEEADDTIMPMGHPDCPLPPGFAQSYQGPVSVATYLPRKGSLAFVASPLSSPSRSPTKGRPALEETSGNEQRGKIVSQSQKTGSLFGRKASKRKGRVSNVGCAECGELKSEVERLREEVAELKRLLYGKDRRVV